MTKYRSPWLEEFPRSRVPSYSRVTPTSAADVVIIGGGLTGCAAAYAFAAAGQDVVLLEEAAIGRGSTAMSNGWIAEDPGVPFADVERVVGRRAARAAFVAWRRAALDFAALIRRLNIKCQLEPQASVTAAVSAEQATQLKRDLKARRDAGLDAPLLSAKAVAGDVAIDSAGALRHRDGATIDPYRACVGLAAAAADRGAAIFEKSPVSRVTFTRKYADVFSAAGPIRTTRVIVATGMPTRLYRSLARHFWFHTSYSAMTEPVPAKIRNQLGRRTSVFRDLARPPHIVRWVGGDRLLISGADGDAIPPRQRDKALVQRTGQLMYELSMLYPLISGIQPQYGWATDYARTAEGLPYLGAHRNFPFHLFAFGDSSRSVTGSYLASRVLLRQHSGEMDPADAAFSFNR